MQLDISARLTRQVTTILYHYMKRISLKKKKKKENTKKYGGLDQNPYVKKHDT